MDVELKTYLEAKFGSMDEKFVSLEKTVDTKIEALKETVNAKIDPIHETLHRHTGDIQELYEENKEQVKDCGVHRQKIETDIKNRRQWSTGQIITVVCVFISIGGAFIIAIAGG
jgi:predicted  nucleic acid-binding Zn-ribbon protein